MCYKATKPKLIIKPHIEAGGKQLYVLSDLHTHTAFSVVLGPTYQQQLHGELDGVAVEGDADALVDSQSHHSGEEQQDAGRVCFRERNAVVNYVLKEENISEVSLGGVTAVEL